MKVASLHQSNVLRPPPSTTLCVYVAFSTGPYSFFSVGILAGGAVFVLLLLSIIILGIIVILIGMTNTYTMPLSIEWYFISFEGCHKQKLKRK